MEEENHATQKENHPSHAHDQSETQRLLEKNIELTQEVLDLTKKINGFVVWQKMFGVLKIFIIVIPIVLGIIYLPPLMEQAFNMYRDLLGSRETWQEVSGGIKAAPSNIINSIK